MTIAIVLYCLLAVAFIATFLFPGERLNTVLRNARLRRRVVNDSPTSSASPPTNTTRYLNTREELAQFVSDFRSLTSASRSITITKPEWFGDYCVSCVTSESSEPVLRVYLSRRLLTSLTLQELRFWERELRQVGHERNDASEPAGPTAEDWAFVCRREDFGGYAP